MTSGISTQMYALSNLRRDASDPDRRRQSSNVGRYLPRSQISVGATEDGYLRLVPLIFIALIFKSFRSLYVKENNIGAAWFVTAM